MNVLIIDDEPDICFLLNGILRNAGIHSFYVNTLKEAGVYLDKNPVEIVFLDNHLPDGTGIDFIHYIKQKHTKARVIMITAYDTPADRHNAFCAGADDFIAKPFSKQLIIEAINNLPGN